MSKLDIENSLIERNGSFSESVSTTFVHDFRSNFPESRVSFSKVPSAKLNSDETILISSTGYFGETALKQDITYLSTPWVNHTFTLTLSGH